MGKRTINNGVRTSPEGGFTLMEVLVALLILSTSIYILLGHHYSIMGLQQTISDELIYNQLVETAVGKAEFGVLTGKLADAGDFGERFAEYNWSYAAILQGEDELIPLYAIQVTINAPSDSRVYDLFFYNTGNLENGEDGGRDSRDNSSNRNSSNSSSSSRASSSQRENDRGGSSSFSNRSGSGMGSTSSRGSSSSNRGDRGRF